MIRIFIVTYCLLHAVFLNAQKYDYGFYSNISRGKLVKHNSKVKNLSLSPAIFIETGIRLQTIGTEEWERRYRKPSINLGFTFTNYGNVHLGHSVGLYTGFIIPLVCVKEQFNLDFNLGFGLAYLNKTAANDTVNNMIGSHLNNITRVGLQAEYQITDNIAASLLATAIHSSNGSFNKPNLGINLLTTGIGINYKFKTRKKQLNTKQDSTFKRKLLLESNVMYGISQYYIGPKHQQSFCLTVLPKIQLSRYITLGMGTTVEYNTAAKYYLKQNNNVVTFRKELRSSFYTQLDLYLGHFSVFYGKGIYLQDYIKIRPTFDTFGVNYHLQSTSETFHHNCFIGFGVKAHKFVAEYPYVKCGVIF